MASKRGALSVFLIVYFFSAKAQKCEEDSVAERHTLERAHGDVCRHVAHGDFTCPSGCLQAQTAPFCIKKNFGEPPVPCRLKQNHVSRVAMLQERLNELVANRRARGNSCTACNNQIKLVKFDLQKAKHDEAMQKYKEDDEQRGEESGGSEAYDGAGSFTVSGVREACDVDAASSLPDMEWVEGLAVELEFHATQIDHGDVCRTEDGSYFCPTSCLPVTRPPYCTAADESLPCRITVLNAKEGGSMRRNLLRGAREMPQEPEIRR